jgi:2,4-dienoyl-CoA reductase-like NADH-dependent reductase (Old Yellow Enzyme family)
MNPITLPCGLEFASPVAFAPLTNVQSHADGTLSDVEFHWLLMRAQGGFEWLSTCATYVSDGGKAWDGQLGIAADLHVEGLTKLAAALKAEGAKPFVQLHHGGPMANMSPTGPVAAMAREGVRQATLNEILQFKIDFVEAAKRAESAGFSGVELHGANGYLFTNFLSPVDNTRSDAYGDGLAGRALLLRETMRAVRAAVSPHFAVGVRLSPIDLFMARGILLKESLQTARWLVEDGADFIHLSLKNALGTAPEDPSGPKILSAFRQALPAHVPLLAAGGIWTHADLKEVLEAGADIGVIGTAAIIHPDWPRVSLQAEWTPTRLPFPVDELRAAGVGEGLMGYLMKRPGFVHGGAPPRR